MKNAFWAYWLILLGVLIVVIMLLVQSVTSNNTEDYYLIKELTEAAMVDSVDYAYYRQYGEIKMNKEKFYESFIRRFAENASLTSTYTVSFYDVYETPPKASVEVKSKSGSFTVAGDSTQFDIVNRIDAIIEGNTVTEHGTVEVPDKDTDVTDDNDSTEGNSDSNLGDTVGDSGSGNTDSSSNDNTQNDKPTVSQVKDKEKTENSITVETTVNSTSDTVKEYYFSIDGGNTWQKSDKNTYTYNNLSPSTSYSVQSYVKDSEGNTSNVKEVKIKTSDPASNTCLPDENNIQSTELKGMHGVMMGNYSGDYTTELYHDFDHNDIITKLKSGDMFTILGSRKGKNIEYWAIDFNGTCGWVPNTYAAIDMSEYLSGLVEFDIFNSYGAKYKTTYNGKVYTMDKIYGKQLYSSGYRPLGVYSFAQKVKKAAEAAKKDGYTLVINDAYRPREVTRKLSNEFNKLYANNKAAINSALGGTSASNFLSVGPSAHNTGCAVDITIKGANMPSDMHELSLKASGKNDKSITLSKYMTSAGLQTLWSEWWHFEDNIRGNKNTCHQRIKNTTNGYGVNIWSAV